MVLFLQAAFNVQQVIHFLLELLLRCSQRAELLVLGLQVVLSQVTLLGFLLNLQRQVLHLRGWAKNKGADKLGVAVISLFIMLNLLLLVFCLYFMFLLNY